MKDKRSAEEIILQAQEARKNGQQVPISLPDADLSGLHLPAADLVGADLEGADLTGAILAGAHLSRANLKNAVLIGASLDGADLTDADLRGADLAGARIDDAVLANTRLEGACLQAVFGDPLSMTAARMDQVTIELSEFTMRDIAQMVVRGVDVREHETVPVSLRPSSSAVGEASGVPSGIPSILPLISRDDRKPTSPDQIPSSVPDAPLPVGIRISDAPTSDDPVSSKEVVETISFDSRLSSIPSIRRALGSIPPSAPQPTPISVRAPSPSSPHRSPSIIPAFRAAEISTRLEQATADQEQMPVSQRMFQQLNALIDDARIEAAPPVSLRPQRKDVQKLTSAGFEFPIPGDEYLGVTIADELPRGTTSRCFTGTNQDGVAVVVRVFDPHCEGAALQLPAFQRGLRALNRLQGQADSDVGVVEVLAVAADQTAYVTRHYEGKSLQELLEVTMTLQAGLEAISSLARSMAAIHQQGLMVRSWKPSNVMVDGLELLLSEPDMVHLATLSQYRGDAGGYKAYAAPEELLGRGTRSPTADVFSLGKMLEFLLTGQEPLVPLGSPPLIAQRENIPEVLVELVKRATAQEPSDRYQTVEAFLGDLKRFQEEGDKAVLHAALHPQVISQLSVPPMSTGPEVPNVDKLIREKVKVRQAARRKPQTLAWHRQAEIAAALIGGLGGLAVTILMVLSPRSVDSMEGMGIYLALAIGLLALALPVPSGKRLPYRLGTWAGLSALIWLLDPIQYSALTWSRQLKTGTALEKQQAVKSLSRVGEKDASAAKLDGVRFDSFDLDSLNFSGASLRGANFKRAFLVEAKFDGADVTGANFSGANLFGATLQSAVGLEEARCDRYTILPIGFLCEKGQITQGVEEEKREITSTDRAEEEIQRRVEQRLRGRRL